MSFEFLISLGKASSITHEMPLHTMSPTCLLSFLHFHFKQTLLIHLTFLSLRTHRLTMNTTHRCSLHFITLPSVSTSLSTTRCSHSFHSEIQILIVQSSD
ncbi:hypothetical protein BLNAU_20520 [Blattamonas nauphoetae]|uniref:Uncharacterized protein n=1 Tax=Blattamonas nauphoetae TaxID=2049346 RepID=A0ABQ9WYH2_9EUKA|nr:hypothetical protein BLNAU_20520 [Blattamonas nauphoetae]